MSIQHYENIALSNKDISQLLHGKAKIVLYTELHDYDNIDQILGANGACVLLFEAKPRYGHWVCIFKIDNNTLEFFNPYGGWPDDTLCKININFRKKTHQYYPYLSLLMMNSRYELTYNEFAFQEKNGDIKTCGRHCVVRLMYRYLKLHEYVDLLNRLAKKFGINYDAIVTLLTIK
jgi:hypothetical protein